MSLKVKFSSGTMIIVDKDYWYRYLINLLTMDFIFTLLVDLYDPRFSVRNSIDQEGNQEQENNG